MSPNHEANTNSITMDLSRNGAAVTLFPADEDDLPEEEIIDGGAVEATGGKAITNCGLGTHPLTPICELFS